MVFDSARPTDERDLLAPQKCKVAVVVVPVGLEGVRESDRERERDAKWCEQKKEQEKQGLLDRRGK